MVKSMLPNLRAPIVDSRGLITNDWRRWFEKANALMNVDAAIPEAVEAKKFSGIDAAVVSFDGYFMQVPRLLVADVSSLPTLSAGQIYECKAVDVSTVGFTVSARVKTVGGIVGQPYVLGANVGGVPAWQVKKQTTEDASDKIYRFQISGKVPLFSSDWVDNVRPYSATFIGNFDFYVRSNETWVKVDTKEIQFIASGLTGELLANYPFTNEILDIVNVSAIGLSSGQNMEFGVHPQSGSILTDFVGVSYQIQTFASDVSCGALSVDFWTYP